MKGMRASRRATCAASSIATIPGLATEIGTVETDARVRASTRGDRLVLRLTNSQY
jgi:hypothetical protein